MFFYYRNYPWVGRVRRTRSQVEPPAASETEPGTTSQRPLINTNESTDGFIQSNSSLGVGDSILLNSNTPKSTRETQSDRNSRGRRSVSIREDSTVHYKIGSESEGEPTLAISPPPESARRRNRSGSNSDKDPKWGPYFNSCFNKYWSYSDLCSLLIQILNYNTRSTCSRTVQKDMEEWPSKYFLWFVSSVCFFVLEVSQSIS